MANTFTAPFAQTPVTASAVATTAIALTGAGSIDNDTPSDTVLLATAGSNGAIVTRITAIPRVTVTATNLFLFLRKSTDAAGVRRLIDSALMTAYTVAATTAIPVTTFSLYSETTPIRLAAGDELYVGIGVSFASGIVFKAELTNY
jgi:hypothetical protein